MVADGLGLFEAGLVWQDWELQYIVEDFLELHPNKGPRLFPS
jgi:hypothetical protein